MYSPTSVVTREQYSQFLFNSINVIEKETKPEEKPNTGGEVKPEEKPNTGGEVKPEENQTLEKKRNQLTFQNG